MSTKEKFNKENKENLFGFVVLAALAVVILVAYKLAWPGINIKVDVNTVPTVLAPLILTAMFIERAVEVIISPWRDPGADQKSKALKDAQSNVAAIASQQTAATEYIEYKGKTRRYAFSFALMFGTAAAIVGIRALWPFVDDPNGKFIAATISTDRNTIKPAQGNPINDADRSHARTAFIVVDVILSALLLAGGANGIHSLVTSFTGFFQNNTNQNTQRPPT